MHILKYYLSLLLRRHGKIAFLAQLSPQAKILDVGCGNNSSFVAKKALPHCHYTGLDVGDYNQSKPNLADNYLITTPEQFDQAIARLSSSFDAVISSHNLEHCHKREETLQAMLAALKIGGQIYLAFPCEASVNFPKRIGTLNYFDDHTHQGSPPQFLDVIKMLKENKFVIIYAAQQEKPVLLYLLGLMLEPLSAYLKKVLPGTWQYYGFEAVIWAKKM